LHFKPPARFEALFRVAEPLNRKLLNLFIFEMVADLSNGGKFVDTAFNHFNDLRTIERFWLDCRVLDVSWWLLVDGGQQK
jgi:hypothetical protein